MKMALVAGSAAVLTLLAGCSSDKGGGGGGTPAADREPCGVLTDEQVTNAIDHPPSSHASSEEFKPLQGCVWQTDPEKALLSVGFGPVKEAPIPPNLGKTWVTVDGVGDKATYSRELGTIMVEGGGYIVRVLAVLGRTDSGDERREATTLVARYVLASLGAGPKVDDAEPKPTSTPPSSESEEPTETSEPETTTIPEPDTSDPELPDMPCSDPDKPGCPPPSER